VHYAEAGVQALSDLVHQQPGLGKALIGHDDVGAEGCMPGAQAPDVWECVPRSVEPDGSGCAPGADSGIELPSSQTVSMANCT
jgi:hypothetical protein